MTERLTCHMMPAGANGSELLIFSATPPRLSTTHERAARIGARLVERLAPLELDALVLYDISNESERALGERPFPYLPTMDPADFHARYLGAWDRPVVLYRCVGKYAPDDLRAFLRDQDPARVATVFVGASSHDQPVATDLTTALALWREEGGAVPLGGVAIPERHAVPGGEDRRLLRKQAAGASFFITQIIYDVSAAKDLVSDYYYACHAAAVQPAPIVFTLSVCGSLRTLDFLQWLGVRVPPWIGNVLRNAEDPLEESLEQCKAAASELTDFCRSLGVPFGFNVESVSIRRVEIDAAVRLAEHLRSLLARPAG